MPNTESDQLRPISLRKEANDRLVIEWNDGHQSVYQWTHLRGNCPCAGCLDERAQPSDPLRVLSPKELEPLKLVDVTPVGHYAYKITWSDGHDSGIYTLENLRSLCQCIDCRT